MDKDPDGDDVRKELTAAIDQLEAIYFLTQSLWHPDPREHIHSLRRGAEELPASTLRRFLPHVHEDIRGAKDHYGCTLTDRELMETLRLVTEQARPGFVYLPKTQIARWFTKYEAAFPRWPHMPPHTYVMFLKDISAPSPYMVFIPEAAIFDDAVLMWDHVKEILTDGKDFASREPSQQRRLHSYLRTGLTVVFHFLEAYLNGLAYQCVYDHFDRLSADDRELLTERNAAKGRVRFVSFDRKMREYPSLYAKYGGKEAPPADSAEIQLLIGEGKMVRDSLTHPAPYLDESGEPAKLRRLLTVSGDLLRSVLQAAHQWVLVTEQALRGDPALTAPWLLEHDI